MDQDVQSANPDENLALRFLESPETYREAFAERCANLLRRYVRRLVCSENICPGSASKETFAEDVFALALYKLSRALPQLKSARALHVWLRAIAKSAVIDEMFSRTRRTLGRVREESLDEMITRAAEEPKKSAYELRDVEIALARYHSCHWPDPEAVAIQNERIGVLRNVYTEHSAASNKGAECGVIVALIYSEEMTVRQITSVLGKPKSTIHDILQDNMTAYREMYTRAIDRKPEHRKGSAL